MPQVPSMWRTELWHPLLVHFPVALTFIGLLTKGIAVSLPRNSTMEQYFSFTTTVLLVGAVLGGWLAIYTGTLAEGEVSRHICDPTVVKSHERWAYFTAWMLSATLLADILRFVLPQASWKLWSKILTVLLLSGASLSMGYVGHQGAKVVYQQGGGVYEPAEDCREFE